MRDNLSDEPVKNPVRRKFSQKMNKKKSHEKSFLDSEFTKPVKEVKGRSVKNWKRIVESGVDFDEYED